VTYEELLELALALGLWLETVLTPVAECEQTEERAP
jgi:hypothetical protein